MVLGRRGGFDTTDLWFCYMGYLGLSLLALTRHIVRDEVRFRVLLGDYFGLSW